MNKFINLILFIFLLSVGKLFAQDALALNLTGDTKKATSATSSLPVFEFRASVIEYDLSSIPKEMIGEHAFGKTVSEKLYLLESKYTFEVPIVPGNPQMRTMVRKPVIYDAVSKIERHLKKLVKKGEISVETASSDFHKVLDVAFNVLTSETESFEKAIAGTNDSNSLTHLFTKRVKLLF